MQPIQVDHSGGSRLRFVFDDAVFSFGLAAKATFEDIADDKPQARINLIRNLWSRFEFDGKDEAVADPEVDFPFYDKFVLAH